MPRFRKNGEVKVLGDNYKTNDILKNLVKLSSETILNYFKELNLSFSRKLRMSVLKTTFRNSVIETRQDRHTLADEMNYRLSWFNQFTETQLVNLFKFYKDEELENSYKELFWITVLNDMDTQKVKDHDFKNLFEIKERKTKEDILTFNKTLNDIFFDHENEIDGLTQDQIRPVLYKSSTITEIRELGKKYGVNVPTRLRKNELIELICQELKDRGEYTEEKEEELKKMNLILIQRYTRTHDIKVSTELKKEEVIEYILSNAKQTKESYYVPSASLYETLEEKPEVVEEIVKEEPVIEEEPIVEEVVEEEIVEEKPVEKEIVYVEKPVEKVIYKEPETPVETEKEFDYENVKGRTINTTEYHHTKPKHFNDLIVNEVYLDEIDDTEKTKTEVISETTKEEVIPLRGLYKITPLDERKRKRKRNFFMRFLIFLLSLLFILFLIVFVYTLVTYKGTPSEPEFIQNAEDAVKNFLKWDMFGWFRKITSKIMDLFN